MISATPLADSISPEGVRLTTFQLVYPRWLHPEVMTHRDKSRNAASSRAIPTERLIEQAHVAPFVPKTFNKRVTGMGVGDPLSWEDQREAERLWLMARDAACTAATRMTELNDGEGIDKSRANRLLEPFLWYTTIFSGTEWDNMLALRDHPGAQPEIQELARAIKRAFADSRPRPLLHGEWHLPLVEDGELLTPDAWAAAEEGLGIKIGQAKAVEVWKLISASRCARVSWNKHAEKEPMVKTVQRAITLRGNGHFSPFEHLARTFTRDEWEMVRRLKAYIGEYVGFGNTIDQTTRDQLSEQVEFRGNFRGWIQARKEIPYESRFDIATATEL